MVGGNACAASPMIATLPSGVVHSCRGGTTCRGQNVILESLSFSRRISCTTSGQWGILALMSSCRRCVSRRNSSYSWRVRSSIGTCVATKIRLPLASSGPIMTLPAFVSCKHGIRYESGTSG
ncbi:hypothetical protein M3J09_012580 [Ascochyta lentis]